MKSVKISVLAIFLLFNLSTNAQLIQSPDLADVSPSLETVRANYSEDSGTTDKHPSKEEKFASEQLLKIQNFNKLSPGEKKETLEKITSAEAGLNFFEIPGEFRLPLELVYIAHSRNEFNVIPKLRTVYYVPNVDLLYQISLRGWESSLKYGEDSPSMETVLAILAQETWMTDVTGDNNQSRGMCHLHKRTAEWLLESPKFKNTFSKYFYFDEHNNHIFYSQDCMVAFVYDFLVLVKGYKKGNELKGIERYNGAGPKARKYAKKVSKKIEKYSVFIEVHKNASFFVVGDEDEYLDKVLEKIVLTTSDENNDEKSIINQNKINILKRMYLDLKYPAPNYLYVPGEPIGSVNGIMGSYDYVEVPEIADGRPYIIKEPDKTLFSYFRGNLWRATEYHNAVVKDDSKIFLYYWGIDANGKKEKRLIVSEEEKDRKMKEGCMIYSAMSNDTIYVEPGTKIWYYEKDDKKNAFTMYVVPY